jgi:anti-anti-sigma factor
VHQDPVHARRAPHGATPVPASGDGPELLVHLAGDLDYTAVRGALRLIERTAERAPSGIVVDLNDVDFVDSSGMRLLYEAAQTCRTRGIAFHVDGVNSRISRDLEVGGVLDELTGPHP